MAGFQSYIQKMIKYTEETNNFPICFNCKFMTYIGRMHIKSFDKNKNTTLNVWNLKWFFIDHINIYPKYKFIFYIFPWNLIPFTLRSLIFLVLQLSYSMSMTRKEVEKEIRVKSAIVNKYIVHPFFLTQLSSFINKLILDIVTLKNE